MGAWAPTKLYIALPLGALHAGRRLPGGAANLGTKGSQGAEGQPPLQPHAAEAAADSTVEVMESGDRLTRRR